MGVVKDVIGTISAGTLGFISGNFRGAKRSIGAYNSLRIMAPTKRKRESIKSFVARKQKQSMGKYVLKKLKPKTRVKRVGKVGKQLSVKQKSAVRSIAERVLHGEQPMGKYIKHVNYNCAGPTSSTNTTTQALFNGATFQGAALEDANFSVGSYKKIIDAASILFNSKAVGFYTSTGDLTTEGMIIPSVYHSAEYEFINNTNGTRVLRIYECTTKNDTDSDVYTRYISMTASQKGGTTRQETYFGMKPELYRQFGENYKYKVREVRILPGRRLKYTLKTSTKHLKWEDWFKLGTTTPFLYRKNFTKELLILSWSAVTAGYPATGSFPAVVNGLPESLGHVLGVHFKDTISMRCPSNIADTNNDDNIFCVWNYHDAEVDSTNPDTIMAPAITELVPYQ